MVKLASSPVRRFITLLTRVSFHRHETRVGASSSAGQHLWRVQSVIMSLWESAIKSLVGCFWRASRTGSCECERDKMRAHSRGKHDVDPLGKNLTRDTIYFPGKYILDGFVINASTLRRPTTPSETKCQPPSLPSARPHVLRPCECQPRGFNLSWN